MLKLRILTSVFLFSVPSWSQAADVSAEDIIKKVDELYRSKTSETRITMEIVTPRWSRTMKMDMWSQGMKHTLIRILEPKKDKGIATLRRDDQMWNYFPKVNKTIKVPPSMMMGSWMGSDFTNDDLVRETSLADDYTFGLMPNDGEHHVLELKAKAKTATVWTRIVIVVRKADYLPVRQDYYDEKGKLVRNISFEKIKDFGGRTMPSEMIITPVAKPGNKTVVRYESAKFDLKLKESMFSLRKLRD